MKTDQQFGRIIVAILSFFISFIDTCFAIALSPNNGTSILSQPNTISFWFAIMALFFGVIFILILVFLIKPIE